MANMKAYRMGALQDFVGILTDLEAEGVVDPRFMRERINSEILERSKELAKRKFKIGIGNRKAQKMTCPDCNHTLKFCAMTEAVHCHCGWSRRISK